MCWLRRNGRTCSTFDYNAEFRDYESVIVDTAGRALDLIEQHIIFEMRDSKLRSGLSLSLRGYGELRNQFIGWLKKLRGQTQRTIILTAHAREETRQDQTHVRIDATGSAKEELYKVADMMGQIYIQEGRRTISWDPIDTAFGKNPGGLPALAIRDPAEAPRALADAIATTRTEMENRAEINQHESERLQGLTQTCEGAIVRSEPPEWWTEQVGKVSDKRDKSIIHKMAKQAGYRYSNSVGGYYDPQAAADDAEPETESADA